MAPALIHARALTKHYRVAQREGGLAAALLALFSRTYKDVVAVHEISFDIMRGERVALLGPNGAGKTTTLKMLAGLLHPSGGELSVAGFEPRRREAAFLHAISLVMGQKRQLSWDLPPLDSYRLLRVIYGIGLADYQRRLDEMVALLELEDVVRKPTRQLSLGERMKAELVAALLHAPQIAFLDEPTIGMDVAMQQRVRNFVLQMNREHGTTVILTSHDMHDVEELCERVLLIDTGTLHFDGAIGELVKKVRPMRRISIRLDQSPLESGAFARLELGGREALWDPNTQILTVDVLPDAVVSSVSQLLALPSARDLEVSGAPLDEVMRELFARQKAQRSALRDEGRG